MNATAPSPCGKPRGEWRNFAAVFDRLRPPLRPSPSDVENVRRSIDGRDGRVLLLGVTPELSVLGRELTAVDNSARMIERVWPGDGRARRALLGDWTDLPFDDDTFDAVIGDGSLNSALECVEAVLREVRRVVRPGGRAVFRNFCSPDEPESLVAIKDDLAAGRPGNLHALKWRVAMALAASRPDAIVPVRQILEAFDEMFPDRAALAASTGWRIEEIATLDAYSGADHSMGFPTLSRLLQLADSYFSGANTVAAGGYPLAERCPTIVWTAEERTGLPETRQQAREMGRKPIA